MRTIALILFLLTELNVLGQTILTGTIVGRSVDSWMKYTTVKLFHGDSIDRSKSFISNLGVPFVLIAPDTDTIGIAIDYCGCGLFIVKNIPMIRNKVNDIGLIKVDLDNRSGLCPIDHRDKVIPVAYGLPSKEMRKQGDKGEIHLGGCDVFCTEKSFYCTVHKLTF